MGRWKGWHGLAAPQASGPARNGPPVSKKMSAAQASYLRDLCARAGVPFDPKWTRSQASRRIDTLKLVDGERAR
jgi:hypothetical protein